LGVLLVIGRIGRPQGLKGEVTVEVRTDRPEERFALGSSVLTDPAERGPLTIRSVREQSGRLILAFDQAADRTQAELLRNVLLVADVDLDQPGDDEDDFHDQQLMGMAVQLADATLVGTVVDVIHLPSQDMLAVESAHGEILVPFVREIVPVVDLPTRTITIAPPPGLLPDAEEGVVDED
jgi:16S rRNA processing protein RimM